MRYKTDAARSWSSYPMTSPLPLSGTPQFFRKGLVERVNMTLPWFRLYSEFVSDPKIQLLAFEDQRHFVAILCLKCNGTLDTGAASQSHFERLICKALGLDPVSGAEAKRRLIDVGLIDTTWQPAAWERRQYESDSSTNRTRKWREKQREMSNGTSLKRHSDASVTDKNRTEQNRTEHLSGSPTDEIFNHWKETFSHPKSVLDQKRKKVISNALKMFNSDDIRKALSGYRKSRWHMGENDRKKVFDDIELLLRDAKHVEAGIKLFNDKNAEFEGMPWI